MRNSEFLQSLLKIGNINAERLQKSYEHLQDYFPFNDIFFEHITYEQLASTDHLTTRFSKLQDIIGSKLFPLILKEQDEDISELSYLDRLNLLEKLNFLPSAQDWRKMRDTRNHLMHEYPNDLKLMAKYFNDAMVETKKLLVYWQDLKKKIGNLLS
jgi:hypothetical protein